jgi:hypothetical protein
MRFYSLGQLSNSEKNNILNKHKEIYNGYKQVYQPVSDEQPLYIYDSAGDKNGVTVSNSGEVSGYSNKIYMRESKEQMCSECGGMMYEGECSECGYGKMEGEMEEGIYDVKDLKKGEEFDYVGGDANLEEYEPMESAFADELEEIEGPLYSEVKPAYNFKSEGPMYADGPYGGMREEELDEIDLEKLEKGRKYKYSTPAFEDELEFDKEVTYPFGNPMYSFKGQKAQGHLMGGGHVKDFVSDFDEENFEDQFDGEKYSAFDKIRMGMEPEDVEFEDIDDDDFEDVDDDIKESFITQKNKINEMFNRMGRYN